ncbi:MAG TPA: hypothetical protein VN918_10890 [Myxococcaceae bacterium]|nr:hypothetical protein [Myxococcaceae bacterium]
MIGQQPTPIGPEKSQAEWSLLESSAKYLLASHQSQLGGSTMPAIAIDKQNGNDNEHEYKYPSHEDDRGAIADRKRYTGAKGGDEPNQSKP